MKRKWIEVYNFDELTTPMMEAITKGDVKLAEEYRTKILTKFREEIRRVCEEVISMRDDDK